MRGPIFNAVFYLLFIFTFSLQFSSCTTKKEEPKLNQQKVSQVDTVKAAPREPVEKKASDVIITVQGENKFNEIINSDKNRLFVIDFYADWCQPCRILSPMIKEIAKEYKEMASFCKVDIDKNRPLAVKYKVSGIPHIVFIKNGAIIHSMTGLMAKEAYIEAIKKFSGAIS